MSVFKKRGFHATSKVMINIIEIFPKLARAFPKTIEGIIWFGMSMVSFYHSFSENTFFNMAFENAQGLEKVGNAFLSPVQYLCDGKLITYNETSDTFTLKQRFNYETRKRIFSPLAFSTLPPGLFFGTVIKSLAYFSPETRERHKKLKAFLSSTDVHSNIDYFQSFGIQVEDFRTAPYISPPAHQRRPGDENNLIDDKKALQEITKLLSEKGIPFWVDCGTCLGAYRYGGIIPWDNDLDLAAIEEDFENIMHALQALDETKYVVQDWSNRCRPGTYIRVYIKSNRNHIDIYLSAIDAENETLTNILSYGESHFMAESWKIRERMFGKPVPFDVIFPLKKAKFDGIDIPVPNQIEVYLSYKYGPNISPVMIYNEATDHYEKDLSHPYWGIPLVH